MAKLAQTVQRFAVLHLARYDKPSEVQAAIKENFGVDVTLPQLGHYDPTTVQGRQLAKKWKTLFLEERERVNRELDDIPLYHRGYRLRELQRLYDNPMVARNPMFCRDTLIEAEKITGEVYTNRQKLEHSGKVEGSVGVLAVPTPVSAEEWAGLAAAQQRELAKHRENGAGAPSPEPAPPTKKSGKRFTLHGNGGG